jgi:hypothetical protein
VEADVEVTGVGVADKRTGDVTEGTKEDADEDAAEAQTEGVTLTLMEDAAEEVLAIVAIVAIVRQLSIAS